MPAPVALTLRPEPDTANHGRLQSIVLSAYRYPLNRDTMSHGKKDTTAALLVHMVHRPGCSEPWKARQFCKCGANAGCPSCGWGKGQTPCACTPKLDYQSYNAAAVLPQ